MRKTMLLLLAVTFSCFSTTTPSFSPKNDTAIDAVKRVVNEVAMQTNALAIENMLNAQIQNKAVINKVMTSIQCARELHIDHNKILTIIDYSMPSNQKRMWVFDLDQKKMLFNTYVSHGIKSGDLLSKYFSNKSNSKASSIGVYKTEETYYGRDGLSLRLNGLDKGFNDRALDRYVVMHGGWYVEETFIKKYGRAGRSWGCPAIPEQLVPSIINTIKDKSFFVVYYPSDAWFVKSKFLNCNHLAQTPALSSISEEPQLSDNQLREEIFFADLNHDNAREENEAVLVVSADNYQKLFQKSAPVSRMLRRQIANMEYVALNGQEMEQLALPINTPEKMSSVYFVIPTLKMRHGRYATEMQMVSFGKIKEFKSFMDTTINPTQKTYVVSFEDKPNVYLRPTHQFIRWLGL